MTFLLYCIFFYELCFWLDSQCYFTRCHYGKGNEVTVQSKEGVCYRRNIAHLRKYYTPLSIDAGEIETSDQDAVQQSGRTDGPDDRMLPNHLDDTTSFAPNMPRRSSRVSQKPTFLKDFICGPK